MAAYHTALLIGRFQPFHKGHLYLLQTALSLAEEVVIALGSSNVLDEKNPLSYESRVQMLQSVLEHEGVGDRVRAIVPSPDDTSDEVWLKTLLQNVGPFDIALGNNDWVNDVLRQAGYNALTLPDLERDIFQVTFIRQIMKDGGEWESRVPQYLIPFYRQKLTQEEDVHPSQHD